jgi:hypothetical protein
VPVDQVRVVVGERAEEPGGVLHEAGEKHHAQAEVGRRDGRRAAGDERLLRGRAVRRPVGRADDEMAYAGGEGGAQVRQDGFARGEVEDEVRSIEALGGVAGGGVGHAEDGGRRRAAAHERGGDRAAHTSVADDDAVQFLRLQFVRPLDGRSWTNKDRDHLWVVAALGALPWLRGSFRTPPSPRALPPGRAASASPWASRS